MKKLLIIILLLNESNQIIQWMNQESSKSKTMGKIQINYMPRKWQQEFHKNMEQKKRAILVLHRRAGKTTAIVNQLQKDAMLVPNSQYAYICPFKDQAKRVA
jgi:superfamily II DNA or RNA helicase